MSARNFDIFNPRKYGNVRVSHGEEMRGEIVHVTLHSTVVLRWDRDTNRVTLNSGGWRTVTTKQAINTALRQTGRFDGVFLAQAKGEWYLEHKGNRIPYDDGIILEIVAGKLVKR